MQLHHLEIANFRKLLSVRVDLSDKTTLLVGANNSGKSSAMLALRRFLVSKPSSFRSLDFTLSHFATIDAMGMAWEQAADGDPVPAASDWAPLLPMLDIWISAKEGEVHHLRDLIPNFAWKNGLVGVRFRLEPKDMEAFYKDYRVERARVVLLAAEATKTAAVGSKQLTLWPVSLTDYLNRRLSSHFTVRWYRLDPALLVSPDPVTRMAQPQALGVLSTPLDQNPLNGLIRVHEINAQRGFGEVGSEDWDDDESPARSGRKLSEQLRTYYRRHLDPGETPDVSDLSALRAIEAAQDAFDLRLTSSFEPALKEVEGLGYPGANDPKIRVSTRLGAVDGMNHEAAVLFELESVGGAAGAPPLRLPETSNGLGYQNLISMIFRLMSFRDAWLRKNKAAKPLTDTGIEPIHLVLIEEPEAHLHVQVQQVFVKHAYHVLRRDKLLEDFPNLTTQLVVSSHSSHVAHEVNYDCLRYFRRLPAGMNGVSVPVSTVSNLAYVFGQGTQTKEFVTRYLRAQHADVFFADAIILVEGAAERMVLPQFIRNHFTLLDQCYITVLDIGGSHAHRLRPLVDALGLITLVITDLDAGLEKKAVPVQRKAGQRSNNPTVQHWMRGLKKQPTVDLLLDLVDAEKENEIDDLFAIRIAYQTPITVTLPKTGGQEEALPNTFEDALVLTNTTHFVSKTGKGLVRKFATALKDSADAGALGTALFEALRDGDKAEFALTVLGDQQFDSLQIPTYIKDGLVWLQGRVAKKQNEILVGTPPVGGVAP
jgi:predicted ATP-dependent endonuclease of OLD family